MNPELLHETWSVREAFRAQDTEGKPTLVYLQINGTRSLELCARPARIFR